MASGVSQGVADAFFLTPSPPLAAPAVRAFYGPLQGARLAWNSVSMTPSAVAHRFAILCNRLPCRTGASDRADGADLLISKQYRIVLAEVSDGDCNYRRTIVAGLNGWAANYTHLSCKDDN
jgi:hypothetical protein